MQIKDPVGYVRKEIDKFTQAVKYYSKKVYTADTMIPGNYDNTFDRTNVDDCLKIYNDAAEMTEFDKKNLKDYKVSYYYPKSIDIYMLGMTMLELLSQNGIYEVELFKQNPGFYSLIKHMVNPNPINRAVDNDLKRYLDYFSKSSVLCVVQ